MLYFIDSILALSKLTHWSRFFSSNPCSLHRHLTYYISCSSLLFQQDFIHCFFLIRSLDQSLKLQLCHHALLLLSLTLCLITRNGCLQWPYHFIHYSPIILLHLISMSQLIMCHLLRIVHIIHMSTYKILTFFSHTSLGLHGRRHLHHRLKHL